MHYKKDPRGKYVHVSTVFMQHKIILVQKTDIHDYVSHVEGILQYFTNGWKEQKIILIVPKIC